MVLRCMAAMRKRSRFALFKKTGGSRTLAGAW
jgi:hypothetical protein